MRRRFTPKKKKKLRWSVITKHRSSKGQVEELQITGISIADSRRLRNLTACRSVRSNQHGVSGNDPNFRRDRNHCVSLYKNLLQQRAFCKSVPSNIGYYCNSMLLDDVGNRIPCTDETSYSPNFE
ncbi:hypothetical protein F0562_008748 [Nyssa sinensis]|uniref:Uncharacterized protein n=1 Tax=Nyssa sinensis TaxID=561372 RepID=A0A5J5A7Z1_9ASTE|nr:hypothetical protein F0562_008748 [Nyssa sinensis]